MSNTYLIRFLTWSILILLSPNSILADDTAIPSIEEQGEILGPIREEIQRYNGYEALFYRFVTLPYDMTMNTNVKGFFLDIGFLFLGLLPLLFFKKNIANLEKWGIGILLSLFIIISIPVNFANQANIPIQSVGPVVAEQLAFRGTQTWTVRHATLKTTQIVNQAFQPIHNLLKQHIGESDAITLPFLLISMIWGLYLLHKLSRSQPIAIRSLLILTALYVFFWFYLAAGIVWYGILFFPLALGLIFKSIQNEPKWMKVAIYGLSGLWLCFALPFRFADYHPTNETLAKGLIDPNTLLYQSGDLDKSSYLETFFPKYNTAIAELNQDENTLIYTVNTMLPFFIKKSDQRLIKDGQLELFSGLNNTFPDKVKLAQVLEASNIQYLLIGLQTASIDRTPEQSLRKKYQQLLDFLEDNGQLELVVTDRIIANQEGDQSDSLFGEEILQFGTFALFRMKKLEVIESY